MGNSITLWRHRDFLKLWVGQAVSELGSRITREGLPLTAVMVLHASPSQMGLLAGLNGIAVLLFGLSAGVWGDRLRRRPVLIATDLGRAILLFTVPLAAWLHLLSMLELYVVAALAGVLTVFFDVAYQSYLPSLVDREHIVEGNAKLMLSATTAEIAGPALTGILVKLITAPIAILLDALSFVFSAGMVTWIRKRESAPLARHPAQSLWAETTAGLQFIVAQPVLRALALRAVTAYFFFGFIGSLYVIYVLDNLKLDTVQLGLTTAMGGLGGVIGSALSPRIVRSFGLGRTLVAASLVHGLMAMLLPVAHAPAAYAIPFLVALQLVGDCGFAVYMINELSFRQKAAPEAVLGRVNAAMQLATRGTMPVGAFVGGFLADALGVRLVLAIAASGIILSTGWLLNGELLRTGRRGVL